MTSEEIYTMLQKVHKATDKKDMALKVVAQCLEAMERGESVDVTSLLKTVKEALE